MVTCSGQPSELLDPFVRLAQPGRSASWPSTRRPRPSPRWASRSVSATATGWSLTLPA